MLKGSRSLVISENHLSHKKVYLDTSGRGREGGGATNGGEIASGVRWRKGGVYFL